MARSQTSWSEWTMADVVRVNAQKAQGAGQAPPGTTVATPTLLPVQRRTKYRSKACVFEGMTFESRREMETYIDLKHREAAGLIEKLERQVPYTLHAYCPTSEGIVGEAIGTYVADFRYVDRRDGRTYIIDAKGYRTPLFLWKANHFEKEYKLRLDLV